MAGIGMKAARKNPDEFVIDVRVILGPTLRRVLAMRDLIDMCCSFASNSKNASAITNMSSTPNPRTRNGSTYNKIKYDTCTSLVVRTGLHGFL